MAADFAISAIGDVDIAEPDQCQQATAEFPAETEVQLDLGEESNVEPVETLAAETSDDLAPEAASSVDENGSEASETAASETDSIAAESDALANESVTPYPLDLSDGMDGFFGSLDADSPIESLEFSTPTDGMASIVLASSFEDGHVEMTITDSGGNIVEAESSNDEDFTTMTFEAEANETYQLTIESRDPTCDGHFQVTVGLEAFVDQHVDEIGSESTELLWNDGQIDVTGKLETAGDVDTFHFAAESDGEVLLQLNELEEVDRVDLDIEVFDSDGNVIADGSTNEMLQMSFDVSQDTEYFVAVSADEGQSGDYSIGMTLEESTRPNPETSSLVDEAPTTDTSVEDTPVDPGEEIAADAGDESTTDAVEIVEDVAETVAEDAPVAAIDESVENPTVDEIDAAEEVVDELLDDDLDEADSSIESDPDPISETVSEPEIDETLTDDVSSEIVSEPEEELESPVDSGELPVDDSENSVVEETESPADGILVDEETPAEPIVEEVDSAPSDTGSLITGEPESGEAADEPESEIEGELTDSSELVLVDGENGEAIEEQQPIDCFSGIESVDRFFAELGALDSESPVEFGPFRFVGSDLYFWASTSSSLG